MEASSDPNKKKLDDFLRRDPSTSIETREWHELSPEFIAVIRQLKALQVSHEDEKIEDDNHATFMELKQYAESLKRQGEDWQMPEHLSNCKLCLDSFDVILKGIAMPDDDLVNQYFDHSIGDYKRERGVEGTKQKPAASGLRYLWSAVALLVILVGVIVAYDMLTATSIRISSGKLFGDHNQVYTQSCPLAMNTVLSAKAKTTFSVGDPFVFELGDWSQVLFEPPSEDYALQVVLKCGRMKVKTSGKDALLVKTEYGDVIVANADVELDCLAKRKNTARANAGKTVSPYYNKYMDSDAEFRRDLTGVNVTALKGDVTISVEGKEIKLKEGHAMALNIPAY